MIDPCLGPGEGLIVIQLDNGNRRVKSLSLSEYELDGRVQVEQAQTEKGWRKSDPWIERNYKTSKNPHRKLENEKQCTVCSA